MSSKFSVNVAADSNRNIAAQRLLLLSYIRFNVTQADIDRSVCGNRRRCMIATAFKRTFLGEGEHGYVTVDENGIAVTVCAIRRTFGLTKPTKKKAKRFDDDPLNARPFSIRAALIMERPIPPRASRQRMDQINAARRKADVSRKARGEPRPTYTRFV